MKLIKSKGTSYTRYSDSSPIRLARGLEPKDTPDVDRVEPEDLVPFVEEDAKLRLRQIISVLDKVISKRNRLGSFNLQAYCDRVHLSRELWNLATRDDPDLRSLQSVWNAKSHPYAEKKIDFKRPEEDDNAKLISKLQMKKREEGEEPNSREDLEGRWHSVFWKTDEHGVPDYRGTAKAILDHLDRQECNLKGEPRRKGKAETELGLIARRAESIVTGANDPRSAIATEDGSGLDDGEDLEWNEETVAFYFHTDVAKTIRELVGTIETRNAPLRAADVGQVLYDHFEPVLAKLNKKNAVKAERYRTWALHNDIRAFYRKLLKSTRFGIAARTLRDDRTEYAHLKDHERRKVRFLFPASKDALIRALEATDRNKRISALIRLGKMLAHASEIDLPTSDQADGHIILDHRALRERMDAFATSAGQSEIKRNESFVRVWRNAVGLSFQTLRTLTDEPEDLGTNEVIVRASNGTTAEVMNEQVAVLFGTKEIEGRSRAAILSASDDAQAKELLWGLLTLAATVRNKANHFMVRSRLLDLLTKGIVVLHSADRRALGNRRNNEVAQTSLDRFAQLLAFDEAIQARMIIDRLKSLNAESYVGEMQLEHLARELARSESGSAIIVPRFMAVMRKAANLHKAQKDGQDGLDSEAGEWAPPLGQITKIKLDNLSKTSKANRCRYGLLQMVYETGFQDWLQTCTEGDVELDLFVRGLLAEKTRRSEEFQKGQGRFYCHAESALENLSLTNFASLSDLFAEMARLATHASGNSLRYMPDRRKQKDLGKSIEAFKQEIVAALFEDYLGKHGLEWIFDLPEEEREDEVDLEAQLEALSHQTAQPAKDDKQASEEEQQALASVERWSPQFYAWLYLLPPGAVSQLRHQFRKTLVLEGKGKGDVSPVTKIAFAALDRLMGLYTRVQGAGFAGTEQDLSDDEKALFYDDPEQFAEVFDLNPAAQDTSIAGTQRGLRELRRFGHLPVMTKLFEYHRVSKSEVERFTETEGGTVRDLFERKNELKAQIVKLHEDKQSEGMTELGTAYRLAITETTQHDFAIRAARLEEHLCLHQLMMRVVGRLVDFTLIWERDRIFLLLGMIYRQCQEAGTQDKVVLALTHDKRNGRIVELSVPGSGETEPTSLRLWSEGEGFGGFSVGKARGLLVGENQRDYSDHFFGQQEQAKMHTKDGDWKLRQKYHDPKMSAERNHLTGKQQIRNDFAHYNVINGTGPRGPNLTYLTNSVRSLFSYDRKMKNAVSGAIARLLESEGLSIEWKLANDRLKEPAVLPVIEYHLDFVRLEEEGIAPIPTPRTSARFTSMVKGLFDFDKRGYRDLRNEGGEQKRGGALRYPEGVRTLNGASMPEAFLEEQLPAIPLKEAGGIPRR